MRKYLEALHDELKSMPLSALDKSIASVEFEQVEETRFSKESLCVSFCAANKECGATSLYIYDNGEHENTDVVRSALAGNLTFDELYD